MQTLEVTSPWDGSVVKTVALDRPASVANTALRLRSAQPAWAAVGAKARALWVRRLRDHLLWNVDSLVATLSAETGKPETEARVEIIFAVEAMRYYAQHADAHLRTKPVRTSPATLGLGRVSVHARPYPLVGVISPWNFPFGLAVVDAIPALLAGAAVVLKPSELTPLSAMALVEAWRAIGAPDVFDCAIGDGEVGAALVEEADYVAFTGSTGTGRAIAVRAAERLIPCSLELGGNDAMIVLADADLERAANAAVFGSLCNGGQMCVSVERIYVEADVHDLFVAKLRAKLSTLPAADIAPLASAAQSDVVVAHVTEAELSGATAQTWHDRRGNWHPPTLLLGVTQTMSCVQEETFGPLLPIIRVADSDEAVALSNDTRFGLSATVWTKNPTKADEVASQLEAGAVNVNCMFSNLFVFDVPQEGWKSSGIGSRFGGAHAIRRYCREQAVMHSRLNLAAEPHWFPYSPRTVATLRVLTNVLRGPAARRAARSHRERGNT